MYLEAAGFRPHYWCSYSMHHARNIRRLHAIILWNKGTQGIRYSNISNFHPKHRIWCQKSRRYSIVICTLQNWSVKTKTHENIRTRWTTSSAWPFSSSHPHLHRILIFICSTNDWLAYFSKCLKRGGMLHTEQKLSKNWQFFNNEKTNSVEKRCEGIFHHLWILWMMMTLFVVIFPTVLQLSCTLVGSIWGISKPLVVTDPNLQRCSPIF